LKRFGKYGRKHGKDMKNMEETQVEMWKWYGKYGRNPSWNVKWYGKQGRKVSRIAIRYGKYRRKMWNDMENIAEK
jgi:hypothetical protein